MACWRKRTCPASALLFWNLALHQVHLNVSQLAILIVFYRWVCLEHVSQCLFPVDWCFGSFHQRLYLSASAGPYFYGSIGWPSGVCLMFSSSLLPSQLSGKRFGAYDMAPWYLCARGKSNAYLLSRL